MKIKSILSVAAMSAVLVSSAAFADDAKVPVDVSGKLFFDYSYLVSKKDKNAPAADKKNQDGFELTRAYVTFDKKIDDMWSGKVTLDSGQVNDSHTFVKNAYGQFKKDLGGVDVKVQAGMVSTPIIDHLDGLIGSRFVYQNYLDKAADVLGSDIDVASADTGVKGEIKIMKMVSLTGMYSNADGYKTLTSKDNDQTTKAYYGLLNINPIEALNVFGYYHSHDTTAAAGQKKADNVVNYYGGGLAWKDKSFKIGATYTIRDGKAASVKEKSTVAEAWANVNVEEFVGVPVFAIGRYAMGTYEKNVANAKVKNEGSSIWGGIGYQFNKNVQVAAMYNTLALKKKTAGATTSDATTDTFSVKAEIIF